MVSFFPQLDSTEGASVAGVAFAVVLAGVGTGAVEVEGAVLEATGAVADAVVAEAEAV